jgi:hypothetical protein
MGCWREELGVNTIVRGGAYASHASGERVAHWPHMLVERLPGTARGESGGREVSERTCARPRWRLRGGSKFVGERREKPTRVEAHLIKVGFCFTSQAS